MDTRGKPMELIAYSLNTLRSSSIPCFMNSPLLQDRVYANGRRLLKCSQSVWGHLGSDEVIQVLTDEERYETLLSFFTYVQPGAM